MAKKAYQKVQKTTGPTLDSKPSGGLSFSMSKDTEKALQEIEAQMDNPEITTADDFVDEAKTLDPIFKDFTNPPELSNASIKARKIIEDKLDPIEIDSLFITGEIRQSVELITGKFWVEYRTLKANEDLYIKKRLSDVRNEVVIYSENRYMLMQLAAHVSSLSGSELPSMVDKDGEISDDLFDQRFKKVADLPMVLLQKVWVNWLFFQDRVAKAMSPDFLGNG